MKRQVPEDALALGQPEGIDGVPLPEEEVLANGGLAGPEVQVVEESRQP